MAPPKKQNVHAWLNMKNVLIFKRFHDITEIKEYILRLIKNASLSPSKDQNILLYGNE